jgi:hypothetical protein
MKLLTDLKPSEVLLLIILFPSTLLVGRVVMKNFEGEISRDKKLSRG